jgi:thiol:disulfide interchange protein DsbC
MKIRLALSAAALVCAIAVGVPAAEPAAPAAKPNTEATLRARLQEKFPGIKIQELGPSPVAGLYEFTAEGDVMYVSADGRFLLDGQIMDIDRRVNVTEAKRSGERKKALATLDEKQMIVFAPASYQHTITVFTDVDCGYCQKLHNEIAQINKLGVRVRYLAYPRSGPGTDSWKTMEAVWCSKDRKDAITRAKAGESIKSDKTCGSTPIRTQYELGDRLGVKGTPAVFTESGQQIGGYLPPDRLLQAIK